VTSSTCSACDLASQLSPNLDTDRSWLASWYIDPYQHILRLHTIMCADSVATVNTCNMLCMYSSTASRAVACHAGQSLPGLSVLSIVQARLQLSFLASGCFSTCTSVSPTLNAAANSNCRASAKHTKAAALPSTTGNCAAECHPPSKALLSPLDSITAAAMTHAQQLQWGQNAQRMQQVAGMWARVGATANFALWGCLALQQLPQGYLGYAASQHCEGRCSQGATHINWKHQHMPGQSVQHRFELTAVRVCAFLLSHAPEPCVQFPLMFVT
jgi:hypothetical protein